MDRSLVNEPLLERNDSSEDDDEESFRYAQRPGDMEETLNDTITVDDQSSLFSKTPVNAPPDKYYLNYIIFYLLGMSTLIPWNFVITAEDYWKYKFRNVTANSSNEDYITPLQARISSDLSFASSMPSTIFLLLHAFFGHRVPIKMRMTGSLVIVLVVFLITTGFVEVDTDQWQDQFFVITIACVVIMNAGTAVLSGALFGISGQFPSEYITAVVSGQALGGIFAALAQIVALTFGAAPKITAFVYFTIGCIVLFVAIFSYMISSKSLYFKYYTVIRHSLVKSNNRRLNPGVVRKDAEPVFRQVLPKIWLYGFSEWIVFVTTLSVYPAVTVLVPSQFHGNGHIWNDLYFMPVVNYLLFNSGDYIGRIAAGMAELPKNSPRWVATLSVLRMLYIPAFMFCNTIPRNFLPVFIHSDYIFIALIGTFAFTNGYLANLALICAPKYVLDHEKEMASSTMAAFLGLGLTFGASLSLLFVSLL